MKLIRTLIKGKTINNKNETTSPKNQLQKQKTVKREIKKNSNYLFKKLLKKKWGISNELTNQFSRFTCSTRATLSSCRRRSRIPQIQNTQWNEALMFRLLVALIEFQFLHFFSGKNPINPLLIRRRSVNRWIFHALFSLRLFYCCRRPGTRSPRRTSKR